MRRFLAVRYGIALLTLLLVSAVYADDPPNPGDPPEARIKPPIGAQARILPPIGTPSTDARIHPPGGAPQARIMPPIGVTPPEPSFFEQFLDWLVLQARIHPPIG